MAKPGPQPTPTAAKKLAGNPGRRPLNENEPVPESGAPEMPSHLHGAAAQAWVWLCECLDKMDLLSKADGMLMARCCRNWAKYVAACGDLDEHGAIMISVKRHRDGSETRTPYLGPYLAQEANWEKRLAACEAALGLGPTWRAGAQKVPKAPAGGKGKGRFFDSGLKVVG